MIILAIFGLVLLYILLFWAVPYINWWEDEGYRNSERSFLKDMGPVIAGIHAAVCLIGFILWSIFYTMFYFSK